MSLAHRIQTAQDSINPCRTCSFYQQLPPDDQTAFDTWILEGRPTEALRRMCAEEGLQIGRTSFREHVLNHRPKP